MLREYGARAVVIRKDFVIFEVSGHREETERLVKFFEPYGLIEFVRSARVAITKNTLGFHQTLKEFEKKQPSTDEVVENKYLDQKEEVFSM